MPSVSVHARFPAKHRRLGVLGRLRRGEITSDELAKARVRYRFDTLASLDDGSAMAGWFGCTTLYYGPPALSRLAVIDVISLGDAVDLHVAGESGRPRYGSSRRSLRRAKVPSRLDRPRTALTPARTDYGCDVQQPERAQRA